MRFPTHGLLGGRKRNPSVNIKAVARDVISTLIQRKESSHSRDFGRLAQAPQGDVFRYLLQLLVTEFMGHWRINEPRADAVNLRKCTTNEYSEFRRWRKISEIIALATDLHVVWCHFLCTTLRQSNDSSLRRRIVCLSGISKLCWP